MDDACSTRADELKARSAVAREVVQQDDEQGFGHPRTRLKRRDEGGRGCRRAEEMAGSSRERFDDGRPSWSDSPG